MEISHRITKMALGDVNVGSAEAPWNFPPTERETMIELIQEYKDVFAWSHEDMKGLDPKFYQHQINLATEAKPV